MGPTIAVIGTINPEVITGPIPGLPEWGTQARTPSTEIIYAGSAARVAFPLRALGRQVSVFGVIGDDAFGASCLSELTARGIDISGVERIEGERTASCIAVVREDAQRLYISDTSVLEKCDDSYLTRHASRLLQFDLVLLTGLFEIAGFTMGGVCRLFSNLRASGIVTILDTGWHLGGWTEAALAEFCPLLRETDYILPNRDEILSMTGMDADAETVLRSLRSKEANDIYLKLGDQGAACLVGGMFHRAAPVPVTPINTTAAGECFNAGVLHGLAAGMEPAEILDFANRLSAHYVATGEYGLPA